MLARMKGEGRAIRSGRSEIRVDGLGGTMRKGKMEGDMWGRNVPV